MKDLVLQLTIALQLKGELKVDLLLTTKMLLLLQITDFLRGPDSHGMVFLCVCVAVILCTWVMSVSYPQQLRM